MPATRPVPTETPSDADLASRTLDHLARTVFSSGLDPVVVERRWPGTRQAFGDFSLHDVASMDEDDVEDLATDPRVIRNRSKLRAVIDNAARLEEEIEAHGTAEAWLGSLGGDAEAATEHLIATFRYVGPAGAPGLLARLLCLPRPAGTI